MPPPSRWVPFAAVGVLAGLLLLGGSILALWVISAAGKRSQGLASTSTVITQVQAMNELVMVKYVVEKVVKLESEPSILGADKVVLLVHAVAKAGIDLHTLRPEDIEVHGDTVILRLPPARITDCYLDEKRTEVWSHTTRFWRPMDQELEQNARRLALDQVRAAAGDQGIQKEALQRARDQLQWFLTSLGFKKVEILQR